jgi:hypothetical protein
MEVQTASYSSVTHSTYLQIRQVPADEEVLASLSFALHKFYFCISKSLPFTPHESELEKT